MVGSSFGTPWESSDYEVPNLSLKNEAADARSKSSSLSDFDTKKRATAPVSDFFRV
jgi:hypothetical protein